MKQPRITALALVLAGATLISVLPETADGQSLRGSRVRVNRMYNQAIAHDLYFYKTAQGIRTAARNGRFVKLEENENYEVLSYVYPYVLPTTKLFVERLATQYREACGERLVITSASRPKTQQPRNSSPRSVHPTGMAVDLRKPGGKCLTWLRRALIGLDRSNVVEAIEERRPPHFHVAVYPRPYAQYVEARTGETPAVLAVAQRSYSVRPGDSLWSIARRHNTSVQVLRSANNLDTAVIHPGQRLVIPISSVAGR